MIQTRRNFISSIPMLVGALALDPVHTFSRQFKLSSEFPDEESYADYRAAHYLWHKSQDMNEYAAVFLHKDKVLIDPSTFSDFYSVSSDKNRLIDFFMENPLISRYHSHTKSYDKFLNSLIDSMIKDKELGEEDRETARLLVDKAYELNPELYEKRAINTIPSPSDYPYEDETKISTEIGDISRMFEYKDLMYRFNPNGRVRHGIVSVEENKPPRVVIYDLSPAAQEIFRKSSLAFHGAEAKRAEYENKVYNPHPPEFALVEQYYKATKKVLEDLTASLIKEYTDFFYKYRREHCAVFDTGNGLEPSFNDFKNQLNTTTNFYIEDRGMPDISA